MNYNEVYYKLYDSMINKDKNSLDELLSEDFYLIHMTGLKQNKEEFIESILNGTLNYYEAIHDTIEKIDNVIYGYSRVLAKVFGGGKYYWNLLLKVTFNENNKITLVVASTY